MTDRSVVHSMFSLERTLEAPPERVFAAFAEKDAKARWFEGGEGWTLVEREFDFRLGGRERLVGRWRSGTVTAFDARYFEIVPGERIVYAYEMRLNDKPISVSLATIEIAQAGRGARLVITEQGAFLDGYDDAGSRERGTSELLDRVAASL